MAFLLLPRTRENTSTVGTGALVLTGAVNTDNLTFGAQMSEGDQTFACALSSDGATWEIGLYTMTSGQLARTGARLATSALGTSNVALDGGRVWAVIPHDLQAVFVKLFTPAATDEVLTWDSSLGRFVMRMAGGRTWHKAVALATAAALPANTYANGTSGVGATLTGNSNGALTVDGVAAVVGYRILVKDESTKAHNGIYAVTTVGDGSHPYLLTRATDYDDATDIQQADATVVGVAGTVNKLTIWVSVIPSPYTIGTSDLQWDLLSGVPQGGTDGQVLTLASGAPVWADPTGGGGGAGYPVTNGGTWDADTDWDAGNVVRDRADFYECSDDIPAAPSAAPALDGSTSAASNGSSHLVALTTTTANDLVCLIVSNTSSGHVTSVTSSLTFTLIDRKSDGIYTVELWTAPAPSILTSENITANFSGTLNHAIHVFAWSGVNTLLAFDRNTSLPGYATADVIAGISTSSTHDVIIFYDHTDNVVGGDPSISPTGFTQIGNTSFVPSQSSLSYKAETTKQTGITVDGANGLTAQAYVFALTADNPPPRLDAAHWVRMSGFDDTAFDRQFGTVDNAIPVRKADDTWGIITPGTAGQVINFGTVPQFVSFSAALDAGVSATPGSVLVRGASNWGVVAPGTAGQVLSLGTSATDFKFADPTGGGGGAAVPSSTNTGLTNWLHQGAATTSDLVSGILIRDLTSGGGAHALAKAAPATPYKIAAMLDPAASQFSSMSYMLGFCEATSGTPKLHAIAKTFSGDSTPILGLQVFHYTNPTTFGAVDYDGNHKFDLSGVSKIWLILEDDGTTVHFGFNQDGGDSYFELYSIAKSSGPLSSYGNIFFGSEVYDTGVRGQVVLTAYREM